jgi:hypothetical protein
MSKDVRICGYFSEPKGGLRTKEVGKLCSVLTFILILLCPTPYGNRIFITTFARKICAEISTDAFLDSTKKF